MLHEALYTQMLRLTSYYDLSKEEAEDVIQEAICLACEKPEALMDSKNPKVWIMSTFRNVAKNRRKANQNRNKILVPIEDWMVEKASSCYTLEEVFGLPDRIPRVKESELRLFYRVCLYGESYSDEARRLHITEVACRKRVQRTRQRIIDWMKREKG